MLDLNTRKDAIHEKGRFYFIFACNQCGKDMKILAHRAEKHTGFCAVCSRHQPKNQLRPYEWLYRRLIREASKRGLTVTITFDEFLVFTEITCCRYCNTGINWQEFSHRENAGINLDRLDSSRGYEPGNIAVCCFSCNTRKSNWLNADEFQAVNDFLRTYRCTDNKNELIYTIISWNDN